MTARHIHHFLSVRTNPNLVYIQSLLATNYALIASTSTKISPMTWYKYHITLITKSHCFSCRQSNSPKPAVAKFVRTSLYSSTYPLITVLPSRFVVCKSCCAFHWLHQLDINTCMLVSSILTRYFSSISSSSLTVQPIHLPLYTFLQDKIFVVTQVGLSFWKTLKLLLY